MKHASKLTEGFLKYFLWLLQSNHILLKFLTIHECLAKSDTVRDARPSEALRWVFTAAVVMLIPLPIPPAVRKIIDFQYEMNLFSQYVTSLSNASVPYLPFGWIPKTTGSLQKSPDPECSFLERTCSTPWTIPSSVTLNAALLCQRKKSSHTAEVVTESKRHHCSSKGYTKECTCSAEYDVPPISMSSSTGKQYSHIGVNSSTAKIWVSINILLKVSLNCFYYLWCFVNFISLS